MIKFISHRVTTAIGVCVLTALSARAVPVTVQELSVTPNRVVNITSTTLGTANVYAGITKLLVGGVATDGFCIDPFHWSVSGVQTYDSEPLNLSPKAPGGPMGAAEATQIEQLWLYAYSPSMSASAAAGMQIAIWKIIGAGATGGATFTLNSANDYGAAGLLTWLSSNSSAPRANLLGLTGPGQDYVIPNAGGGGGHGGSVPDGGATLMLLGGSLFGLAIFRRKLSTT